MTLEPGMSLGRYQIQGVLGRGGMANVYKAHHAALDRTVALKVMRASLTEDPDFVERFGREARAIAKLEHPNIVQIFDFDEVDGRSVLAMQYLEGGTLKDHLTTLGGPMAASDVTRIVRGVADALDHAHSLGIVHRDIKPSNIMLTKGGRVVVTDFGIAKLLGTSATLYTSTGVGVGTPDYMSPEQGQGQAVDRRSDIYALGAVAYELLTGKLPFSAETPIAVVIKHIRDPLPAPSSLNPAVTPAVERVIEKSMAKAPADRYATAGDFATALEAAVRMPATATLAVPQRRAQRRSRVLIAVAGGFAAALLMAGGAIAFFSARDATTPSATPAAQTSASASASSVATQTPATSVAAPASPLPSAAPATQAPVAACDPVTGTPQTIFACTATGLPPGATPTITLNGNTTALQPGTVVASDGTYVFRIKPSNAGHYVVTITAGGVSRTLQFDAQ